MNLLLILTVSFNLGCHKDVVIPIPTSTPCNFGLCDTSIIEIVWQRPLSIDTTEWISVPAVLNTNDVLFCRCTFDAGSDTLKLFDSRSGNLKNTWADYLHPSPASPSNIFLSGGKFIYGIWDDVYTIDATSLTSFMKSRVFNGTGLPRINVQGGYIYHTHNGKDIYSSSASNLVRSKIDILKWDTIFTQNKIDNYVPNIERSSIWVDTKGNSVALFQIRYVEFGTATSRDRTDFVAYNITQKQIYFRFNEIDSFKTGSIEYPYIYGNNAYVTLTRSIYCFDLINKKIKWSKTMLPGETFSGAEPFLMVENKLYLKPDNNTLYSLNPETGEQIWVDTNAGVGNYGMFYNNGILYYTCDGSGTIVALDLATRKKIWNEPSPNKYPNKFNGNRRFNNANIGFGGIAIDSAAGLLYTSDFYFGMCLKLPKK